MKLSFDLEIFCNDCEGSEIKMIDEHVDLGGKGVVRQYKCQECMNTVFIILDMNSTRFTLSFKNQEKTEKV